MTRIGRLGGNTSRPLAIVLTLVVGFTVAFGPLGPEPVVALGASSGSATGSSTAPGSASTAPGPLLGQAAPSDSPLPSPTDSAAPSPSDSPSPSPTDSPSPSPSDSPLPSDSPSASPAPSDSPSPSPSASASPSPSSVPLPPGVVDEMGGSVTLGHVTIDVPPGAVSMQTRFFLGTAHGPDYADIPPVEVFALHTKQLDTGGETDRFGLPIRLTVDTSALDLSGLDESSLRIARLGLDGTWDVLPTHVSAAALAADTDQIGTFGVVAKSSAAKIDLTLTSDAPVSGRHRVDPGAAVTVTVRAVPDGPVATGTLFATVPLDWTLTDADGAAVDPTTGELSWPLASLDPGQVVSHRLALRAPEIAAGPSTLETTGSFNARVVRRRAPVTRADTISVLVAPRVVIAHRVLGRVDDATGNATYDGADTDLSSVQRFEILRVRFRVENPDSVPITFTPLIQYEDVATLLPGLPGLHPPAPAFPAPSAGWVPLPAAEAQRGRSKFYVATEDAEYRIGVDPIDQTDTKTPGGGGAQVDGMGLLHLAAQSGAGPFARGAHSQGENPIPAIIIPADGWTEVEFSVRPTVWAEWSTAYTLRLTDGGGAIEPSVHPSVTLMADPAPDGGSGSGRTDPWGLYGVSPAGLKYALAASAFGGSGGSAATASIVKAAGLKAAAGTSPHGDLMMTTDTCATCHRSHTATGPYLQAGAPPQSTVCFTCHNGLGASSDIAGQYAAAAPNDPTTSSYYQHPATAATSGHTNASFEEFKGVLNRHTECTDCHNPHSPTAATLSTMTASGWTASGALAGGSGVDVTNGAAGSAPLYGWLNTPPQGEGTAYPTPNGPLAYEYQVCLKCHSGYTQLPAQDPLHPSRWALDKGVEFNPANLSYHPVEAAGKNQTAAMALSLTETDTTYGYRLWSLSTTDTIRCTQCHASSSLDTAGIAPGARLDDHASANRGILLASYRDRVLNVRGQAYVAGDFQLCFTCHATPPFDDTWGGTRPDTDFSVHGVHMGRATLRGTCTDTDIDHSVGIGTGCLPANGAGSGNAICAECHFRTHSTALKAGSQTGTDGSLVNFAPNVRSFAGLRNWTRSETGVGSCTLTCHGYVHNNVAYPD